MLMHNAVRWGDRPLPARGQGLEEKPELRLTSPPFLSQGHLVRDSSLQSSAGWQAGWIDSRGRQSLRPMGTRIAGVDNVA